MSDSNRDPKLEWNRFWNGIAESIADLPDDQLLAEAREAGQDPAQTAEDVRHLLLDAVKQYRQRPLRKARSDYEISIISLRDRPFSLPIDMPSKRELLSLALSSHPEFQTLTAQWRDLRSIPDSDVDGLLEQLGQLGVLDEPPSKS